MAGGTLWKGYIHFGDIDVPVKLHSAVREDRISFHLLHTRDQVKLRQLLICAYEKRPVPSEEQSKGFEVESGKYIIVRPEELEQTVPEGSRMIEVHEFVKAEHIDPIFLERVYYLEPDSASIQGKGYDALVRVLKDSGMAGICTWTMRKRAYFGSLQAGGNILRLNTLRYADEVLPVASLGLQTATVSDKELKIGSELIKQLTGPFEPQKYENEHQKRLQEMIEKKARGEDIAVVSPRRLEPTGSDNLLKVLEASLKKAA